MSIAVKPEDDVLATRRRLLLIIALIICIVLLLTFLIWGAFVWLGNPGTANTAHTSYVVRIEVPVSNEYQLESHAVAQKYLTALLKHQYRAMWVLLHPQVQAMWPNEAAFATFWLVRFQDYTLQGFVVGKIEGLSRWVNPETMVTYQHVIKLSVSLQLQPKAIILHTVDVPPEDLHPSQIFQNLPFIVQQVVSQNKRPAQFLILDGGPADLEAPILPPIHSVATTVQVPILMYHHISDAPPQNLLDLSLTVTPKHFTQQLDYLKAQGYHTITFNQLFDALYYGGPLPSHPIILTFDDGYEDVYHFAFPILQAHGFSGMFYIITGVVGWKGYMTWPELHEMLAAGMQIGSHTVHHVDLGTTLLLSLAQAQLELQQSQAVLQRNLGIPIQQFCYPSGEPFRSGSLLLQQRIVALLAADGYVGATTDPGITGTYQDNLTPFALLRIRIDGREVFQLFTQNLPWPIKKVA